MKSKEGRRDSLFWFGVAILVGGIFAAGIAGKYGGGLWGVSVGLLIAIFGAAISRYAQSHGTKSEEK